MANTILGKQILWGNTSVTCTFNGSFATTLLQDVEFTSQSDKERIKNAEGNTASLVYSDEERLLTFNFYPDNGTTAFATIAASALTGPGSTLSVVDSYTGWGQNIWAVDKFRQVRGNGKAMLWTFDLSRYPNATCP